MDSCDSSPNQIKQYLATNSAHSCILFLPPSSALFLKVGTVLAYLVSPSIIDAWNWEVSEASARVTCVFHFVCDVCC